jgi:hypothetical protein
MRNYQRDFPNLEQYLAGYFHYGWQNSYDWQGASPNYEDVVHFFTSTNSSDIVSAVISELQRFLELPVTDEQLEEIVSSEFAVSYTPRSRGLTKRQWLAAMIPLLHESPPPSRLRFLSSDSLDKP